MDLNLLTIESARTAVQERQITATALAESFFRKIQSEDGNIHAYLELCKERSLAQAARMDSLADKGELLPPLAGVPLAIKDVMATRGVRTTAGSKILNSFVPAYDCTAVTRLEEAGAVLLGKTNCDEFAMGSSNENSAYGPVRNPRDLSRVPGGSSGGSAAAVAAGTAVAALGSDTGGSIRQPAAFCGVVGLMPTYGRVSRYGLIAFASSLDHIGPITRTVKDAALLLRIIAGRDAMDSTSAEVPVSEYSQEIGRPVRGLRLGVPKEYDRHAARGTQPVEAQAERTPFVDRAQVPLAVAVILDGPDLLARLRVAREHPRPHQRLETVERVEHERLEVVRIGREIVEPGEDLWVRLRHVPAIAIAELIAGYVEAPRAILDVEPDRIGRVRGQRRLADALGSVEAET